MGYKCDITGEAINGKPMVKIPVKLRKVTYVGYYIPDRKSEYEQFNGSSEGFEIVKEIRTTEEKAKELYGPEYVPEIVDTGKIVRFYKPRARKKIEEVTVTLGFEEPVLRDEITDE